MKLFLATGTVALAVRETTEEFLREHGVPTFQPGPPDKELATAPPAKFSLRSHMTPARMQGQSESCTAFGVTACLEFIHNGLDLSEAHLLHQTEKKYGNCKDAISIGNAMQICLDTGVVEEKVWPYDEHQMCWAKPPNVGGVAKHLFLSTIVVYQQPRPKVVAHLQQEGAGLHLSAAETEHDLAEATAPAPTAGCVAKIKAILTRFSQPVVIDVPVFDSPDWNNGPDVQMPKPHLMLGWVEKFAPQATDAETAGGNPGASLGERGWHALAICGYNDQTQRLQFKNSWSQSWGDHGFGTLPYAYVEKYSSVGMHGGSTKEG